MLRLALCVCVTQIARADAVLDWNGHAANATVVANMPAVRKLTRLARFTWPFTTLSMQ